MTLAGTPPTMELAGIGAAELRAQYDIPIELNDAVVANVRFFQTDARPHMERWLGRAGWMPSADAFASE